MQLPSDSVIEERLVKTFPNTRLRELARATGLIQREGGKLKPDALFWALAIGFLSGHYRTLEEFRQEYIDTFGGSLEYSSFHEWFMPALCDFLREVLKRALEDLEHENNHLQGRFEQFREVFITDMTVITLYQSLFETFPAMATTTLERSSTWSRLSVAASQLNSASLTRVRTSSRNSLLGRG